MPIFETHFAVSKYFLALANETGSYISNLKLQKLIFYYQAWYFSYTDKKLFNDDFQAWIHGPVIPESYHNYKKHGYNPIIIDDLDKDYIIKFRAKFNEDERDFLSQVETFYMGKTGYELERLSHSESPWVDARKGIPEDEPSEEVITLKSMKSYYAKYISD